MAGHTQYPDLAAALAEPLGATEFALLFTDLAAAAGPILAAVSGGPDSTALMYGLAAWATVPGRPRVIVATVDHGLRPEARGEAQAVAHAAAALGLAHHVLTWSPSPGRVSQQRARQARYALLEECARQTGAGTLVTAHTQDDQAETLLIRAAAGSGLSGLAGMRPVVAHGSLRHMRPLLGVPKVRLVATCRAEGWAFVEDPSNGNPAYARARWRRLMPRLAEEGLDPARLARLAERLRRADEALDALARAALARSLVVRPNSVVMLDFAALACEPEELGLRALAAAIQAFPGSWPGLAPQSEAHEADGDAPTAGGAMEKSFSSGRDGLAEPGHEADRAGPQAVSQPALRLERLESCFAAFAAALAEGKRLRRTLAGRQLTLDPAGRLAIEPEPLRRRGTGQRGGADA